MVTHKHARESDCRDMKQVKSKRITWHGPFVCVAILKTEKAFVPYVHSSPPSLPPFLPSLSSLPRCCLFARMPRYGTCG